MATGVQSRPDRAWPRVVTAAVIGGATGPAMDLVAHPALLHFRN